MEQIMARQIVVESGKDHTGRTMIAVYGCYFPDPAHANYDLLLEDCLGRLETYANMDYVVIFFSAPMEHRPEYKWMLKAYKELSRKYKKNIKRLFVLHPSLWFKILLWIMSKVLSNKFAAKIEAVDDLDKLAKFIPIEKVFVPPVVTGHDRGLAPVPEGQNETLLPAVRIFGAEVERTAPAGEIPSQVLKVMRQLERSGLQEEGIFRLSPDAVQAEQIRMSMDRDYDIDLGQFSPHALAAALKAYFRQIPTPLLPPSTYAKFGGIFDMSYDTDRIAYIRREVLSRLSNQRRCLLAALFRLLHKTAGSWEVNRMKPRNLAAVWTPNLVRYENPQEELKMLHVSQKFVEIMIDLADGLFPPYEDEDGYSEREGEGEEEEETNSAGKD